MCVTNDAILATDYIHVHFFVHVIDMGDAVGKYEFSRDNKSSFSLLTNSNNIYCNTL